MNSPDTIPRLHFLSERGGYQILSSSLMAHPERRTYFAYLLWDQRRRTVYLRRALSTRTYNFPRAVGRYLEWYDPPNPSSQPFKPVSSFSLPHCARARSYRRCSFGAFVRRTLFPLVVTWFIQPRSVEARREIARERPLSSAFLSASSRRLIDGRYGRVG